MMENQKEAEKKPEISFVIRRAVEADVPDMYAIMEEAAADQTHPDWFVSSDMDYMKRHLAGKGITAIARTEDGEAAGFFVIELPDSDVDELTELLEFTREQRDHTAVMDTAVVTGKYRGYGLQGRMLAFCEAELKGRDLWYYLTTIHPDNRFSLANMQGGGFEVAKRVRCYGGKDRYILMKKLKK